MRAGSRVTLFRIFRSCSRSVVSLCIHHIHNPTGSRANLSGADLDVMPRPASEVVPFRALSISDDISVARIKFDFSYHKVSEWNRNLLSFLLTRPDFPFAPHCRRRSLKQHISSHILFYHSGNNFIILLHEALNVVP